MHPIARAIANRIANRIAYPIARFAFAFALVLALGLTSAPVGAQTTPGSMLESATEPAATETAATPANGDALAPEQIAARLETARADAQRVDRRRTTATTRELGHLDRMSAALEELIGLLEDQKELASERLEATAATDSATGEAPSAFALDRLLDEIDSLDAEATRSRDLVEATRAGLERARARVRETESALRQQRTAAETATGSAASADAARALELAELAARTAREQQRLLEMQLAKLRPASVPEASEASLRADVAAMRQALGRGEGDASAGFENLAELESELARRLESKRRDLASIDLRVKAAENQYASRTPSDPSLLAVVEALAAKRDTIRHEIELLQIEAAEVEAQTAVWRDWQALLSKRLEEADRADVATRTRDRLETLDQSLLRAGVRLAERERALASVSKRLDRLPKDSSLRPILREHRDALKLLVRHEGEVRERMAADRRTVRRLADDLEGSAREIGPLELARRVGRAIRDVWRYEIFAVEDQSITIGSLVLAILLISIGAQLSRIGAKSLRGFAERRFSLDAGVAHALQNLSFYVLLTSFALFALRLIHFPLTAFTVIGGALAIGIGFGSQNVMNNFISGLILMLERPVRAQDVVEVDGNHGTIERIGARSTQIRSTDGRHIVVPNSFFLESNVVNWTLSDDLIRTSVGVGVAYGSDTRLVERLIRQVVTELEGVLQDPTPIILFQEFGDNSLNFEVHFWVLARAPMQMRRVASQVRFRIDDLFREHGVVIAFPQRDVHLDTTRPIEVRMVDGTDADDT
ncbi:MAG: mechanosensitive ion channel [Spirochaetaceae bacterium]|nr:mechanosensitive ion channel [Myxococcales bacterium]MCB9724210.1 mechanosensitive ion channel [Spirochaetaceae bacterium]